MTKDHFVVQTYIKHWCDPEKKPPLQAYRKSNLKPFRCSPRDVCHEWDGDLIPEYFDEPAVLGKFRKIFEPKWKPTVERIGAGTINQEDKLVVSLAWAHFSLCTPAQRERAKAIYANEARALRFNVEIDRDADFFKRFATKHLLKLACVFYNQDWTILLNETKTSFITSDNPSASKPPERVLPISPSLCLYAKIDIPFADTDHFDLGSPPKGSITFTKILRSGAMKINRFTVINANDLVFSQFADVGIEALVKKWRDCSPQVEPVSSSADDGPLTGATLVIRPRTKE